MADDKLRLVYNTLRGDKNLGSEYKGVSYDQFKEVIITNPDARKDVFADLKAQNLVSRDNADDYWAAVGIGSGQPPKVSLAPPTPTNPSSQTASQIAGRPVQVEKRPIAPNVPEPTLRQQMGEMFGIETEPAAKEEPIVEMPQFKQWGSEKELQQEAKSPVFRDNALAQNVLKDREAQEARNPYGYIKELLSGKVIVFSKDGTEPEREFASMNEAQSVLAQQGLKAAPNGLIMPTKEAEEVFNQRPAEEQSQIIEGTTGFKRSQDQADDRRTGWDKWKPAGDVSMSMWEGFKQIAKNTFAAVDDYLAQGEVRAFIAMENKMREEQKKGNKDYDLFQANKDVDQERRQKLYDRASRYEADFQKRISELNIETSVYQALKKGDYSRLPEATAYTVANAAMQIIPAFFTYGASSYLQVVPGQYKAGVEAIAQAKGITPEEVIKSGDDAEIVSKISAMTQAGLDFAGAGMVSKSIATKGGYAAVRDWLIKKGFGKNMARALGITYSGIGEGGTEGLQDAVAITGESGARANSVRNFISRFPKEFWTPKNRERIAESVVAGFVGGLGADVTGQTIRKLTQPPKSLGGIPTQPAGPQPEQGQSLQPVAYGEKNIQVTPEEFQAYQAGTIDPERQAALADDVAKGVTPEQYTESDPLYARMLENEYAKRQTDSAQNTAGAVLNAIEDEFGGGDEQSQLNIEEKRLQTESAIKRKDLFSDGGLFANELGGSGVNSVPTLHKEINGIEFVEFSNPNTGVVDVIMTGTSDVDFVGFYRLYENGKPTNKWSSKFQNGSRNKDNFKTMISGAQAMLPQGHEYTEKTSISTDGLRIWNQQLSRGYELQYDSQGRLVTNRVAINGDALVNELGIPVEVGSFDNIRVSNKKDFDVVKKALLPYLENFGLGEKNVYMVNGTVEIDLPVLINTKNQANANINNSFQSNQNNTDVQVDETEVAPGFDEEVPLDLDAELAALKGLQMEDEEAAPGFDEEIPEESVQLPDDESAVEADSAIPATPEDIGDEAAPAGVDTQPVEPGGPEDQGEVVSGESSAALTDAQKKLKEIFSDIYYNVIGGRNGQILEDGFSNSFDALQRANRVGGNQYSAHGMGKSSIASAFNDLYNLLTNGIDPTRGNGRLYTAPLSGGQQGSGAGIGTSTGNAYMDGPFTLVANRGVGNITDVSQIAGIIVNDGIVEARPEILDVLRSAFPGIVFESTTNTDKLVEQLNKKEATPTEEGPISFGEDVSTALEQQPAENEEVVSEDPQEQPIVKQPAVPLTTGEGGNQNAPVKGRKRVENSLQDLSEAQDPISKLKAIQTFENSVRMAPNAATEEELALIRNEKERLAKEGYEIWDLTGRRFNQGMRVVTKEAIPDENLEEGEEIITTVISPAIMKDGKMVKAAEVRVSVGTKKKQSVPLTTGEGKVEPIDKKAVESLLTKAKDELSAAQTAFDKKKAELNKTTKEDATDLFGNRKVEEGGQSLFGIPRINPAQREKVIQPFRDRLDKAKAEVNRLTTLLNEGQEITQELNFGNNEQVQPASEKVRQRKSPTTDEIVVRKKVAPVRNAGRSADAIAARNVQLLGDPFYSSLQYVMDITYHPDLLQRIFGGPDKNTKSGRKSIEGERKPRFHFLDTKSEIKTADRLGELLAEHYAEINGIDVRQASEKHDFTSIAEEIVSNYTTRSQMVKDVLKRNDQLQDPHTFPYDPSDIYGPDYNEDVAKDVDISLEDIPDSYWEGMELTDEQYNELFAPGGVIQDFDAAQSLKGEEGRNARKALKESMGKEQYKDLETITNKFPQIAKDLESRGVWKIDCP